MNLLPLVIGRSQLLEIKNVLDYADAHRVQLVDLIRMMDRQHGAIGDDPGHCMIIPFGYRVCFSFEQQPKFWCRHISVSVPEAGQCPSPKSVTRILKEFGFVPDLHRCHVDLEEFAPGHHAVSIWQPEKENESLL